MATRRLIFLFWLLGIASLAKAQDKCVQMSYPDQYLFENWLTNTQSIARFKLASEAEYQIPVIVHVVHNGEDVGEGLNISLDQVISQFDVLNADLNRQNSDTVNTPAEFLGVAGKLNISFIPSLVNEVGDTLSEPGINRIDRNIMGFDPPGYSFSYMQNTIQPATIWDPTKYFNIWVTDFTTALGAAQFPTAALPDLDPTADANTDGIIVRSTAFGTTGSVSGTTNLGRTATHEVGHWLGLYHLWGTSAMNACGEDDFVADTPNQDEPNQFCPTSQGPACAGVTREMWENYMDFTYDNCQNLFTNDQVGRMTTVIENSPRRVELLSSTVGEMFNQNMVSFETINSLEFADSSALLNATATSNLAVSYLSSDETIAEVTGNTLLIKGTGQITISALQPGNHFYMPSDTLAQMLTIATSDQIVSFEPIGEIAFGDTVTLQGSSNTGLPIVYTSTDNMIGEIQGQTLIAKGTGEVTISAIQSGNQNFNVADSSQTITIKKAVQEVELVITGNYEYLDTLEYSTSTSSGLPIEILTSSNLESDNGNYVFVNVGEIPVTAVQSGNENYFADSTTQVVSVGPADDLLSVSLMQPVYDTTSAFALSYSTASGLSINLQETTDLLTIMNETIIPESAGLASLLVTTEESILYQQQDTILSFCVLPVALIDENISANPTILSTEYLNGVSWFREGEFLTSSSSFELLDSATYKLNIDIDGCESVDEGFFEAQEDPITGIDNIPTNFRIYPNPAENKLTINLKTLSYPILISIIDASGKVHKHEQIIEENYDIDVADLKSGLYLLTINSPESVFSTRFVKK